MCCYAIAHDFPRKSHTNVAAMAAMVMGGVGGWVGGGAAILK